MAVGCVLDDDAGRRQVFCVPSLHPIGAVNIEHQLIDHAWRVRLDVAVLDGRRLAAYHRAEAVIICATWATLQAFVEQFEVLPRNRR